MTFKLATWLPAAILCLLLSAAAVVAEENYCLARPRLAFEPAPPLVELLAETMGHPNYQGRLRIYVAEPLSRWEAYDYQPYHYGFLDFALDIPLSLAYNESRADTIRWDGNAAGFNNLSANNLIVIAAIFNGAGYTAYSYSGYPFTAYNVDAAAAAKTDSQWSNTVNANYSHTVFIEEGTGTWCPYCPSMRDALSQIYESQQYPMFFVAMVEDKNAKARARLYNDYNIGAFPSAFFDGGYRVYVNGDPFPSQYIQRIAQCGARDAHRFDLSISMDWVSAGVIDVGYVLTNREIINTKPTTPETPTGIAQGAINKPYSFKTVGDDPDGDRLEYRFYWQSGDTSGWYGMHNPLDTCTATHSWGTTGIQYVAVQSRDEYGMLSNWSSTKQVQIFPYVAGDANGNGTVNILDATAIISYLYKQGPAPNPLDAGNANGVGAINILDATYLISYLYKGGMPPVYP